jgi:hypothetical protein
MVKNKQNVSGGFENSNKIPVSVKIISILFYIGTILCFFSGLLMIFASKTRAASLVALNPGLGLEAISQGTLVALIIVIGIVLIGAGVFSFFIGRGIWRLRKWAKITAIVLAIIAVVFVIFSIIVAFTFTQIIYLLIDGFIAGYLLFSKGSKRIFK